MILKGGKSSCAMFDTINLGLVSLTIADWWLQKSHLIWPVFLHRKSVTLSAFQTQYSRKLEVTIIFFTLWMKLMIFNIPWCMSNPCLCCAVVRCVIMSIVYSTVHLSVLWYCSKTNRLTLSHKFALIINFCCHFSLLSVMLTVACESLKQAICIDTIQLSTSSCLVNSIF